MPFRRLQIDFISHSESALSMCTANWCCLLQLRVFQYIDEPLEIEDGKRPFAAGSLWQTVFKESSHFFSVSQTPERYKIVN